MIEFSIIFLFFLHNSTKIDNEKGHNREGDTYVKNI